MPRSPCAVPRAAPVSMETGGPAPRPHLFYKVHRRLPAAGKGARPGCKPRAATLKGSTCGAGSQGGPGVRRRGGSLGRGLAAPCLARLHKALPAGAPYSPGPLLGRELQPAGQRGSTPATSVVSLRLLSLRPPAGSALSTWPGSLRGFSGLPPRFHLPVSVPPGMSLCSRTRRGRGPHGLRQGLPGLGKAQAGHRKNTQKKYHHLPPAPPRPAPAKVPGLPPHPSPPPPTHTHDSIASSLKQGCVQVPSPRRLSTGLQDSTQCVSEVTEIPTPYGCEHVCPYTHTHTSGGPTWEYVIGGKYGQVTVA